MRSLSDHPTLAAYVFVVLGVLLSIALPLLRALLPKPPAVAAAEAGALWSEIRPFVVVACFSILTSVLVLAFAGDAAKSWMWHQALLAGYAWDSTLQKASKPS